LLDSYGLKPRPGKPSHPYGIPGDQEGYGPKRAPGGSGHAGNTPRFVGHSYGKLLEYTLENCSYDAVGQIRGDVKKLKDEVAYEIPCCETKVHYICFTGSHCNYKADHLRKTKTAYTAPTSSYKCFEINVDGKMGCGL